MSSGEVSVGSGGLQGIVAQARAEAQKRGQRLTSAHLLPVMLFRHEATARLLGLAGLGEARLFRVLRKPPEESGATLARVVERAERLADRRGRRADALVLLEAALRDTRSAASCTLDACGISAAQVLASIPDGPMPSSAPQAPPEPKPRRPRPNVDAAQSASDPRGRPRASRRPTNPRPKARRGKPDAVSQTKSPVDAMQDAMQDVLQDESARTSTTKPRAAGATPSKRASLRAVKIGGGSGIRPSPTGPFTLPEDRCPTLARLGRNLTEMAAEGEIDPVIGRGAEVERLLDVLARRRGNNPVLVGAPGVGKTAVVEALALRLAAGGEGMGGLEGRLLIELSAGRLVSGTGVRGALSERVRTITDEVASMDGRVILFIDEIHAVVGGGEGPDDLAHELKAALARGALPCVGATTEAEYRKHFERDAALARRFSPIHVTEPSVDATVEILRGIVPKYELHHAVAYDPAALRTAVELSVRYLPDRRLPDKAIGVVDLAAARVRRRGGDIVDDAAIAAVIAEQARVPQERLLLRDADRLLTLEASLGERVVGHQAALVRISDALRKAAAGFRGRRPLGTFLLLGPTGVGKTETAKAIADVFFPGTGMTRIDMSELSEAHGVARLLGAPPGYVGHDAGGHLTEPVRRRPFQLVLLDEIEKAHPDVLLSLLPLLDEGRLTDGRGRTVDFTNTIIILTSNLGANAAAPKDRQRIGFGGERDAHERAREDAKLNERALEAARAALPPELWNRIDEPLWFGALTEADVREIAARLLGSTAELMRSERDLRVSWAPEVVDALVDAGGYDVTLGARPMKRVVGRLVEGPLAEAILARRFSAGDQVRLVRMGDVIGFERRARSRTASAVAPLAVHADVHAEEASDGAATAVEEDLDLNVAE